MIKEMIPNIRISNDARELVLNCCTGIFPTTVKDKMKIFF